MCARFTVLSDTPIAAEIAGCVIPLSRNSTIWMRWRCVTGIFHRSAVFSRRTSALLHLTICCPESDGASESHLGEENSPDYLSKISIQAVMEVVLGVESCLLCRSRHSGPASSRSDGRAGRGWADAGSPDT